MNSYFARRRIRIHKAVSAARDRRMGILSELIGAVCILLDSTFPISYSSYVKVKFIKFFAWEERWINKAMDSREDEMKWIIKCKINFDWNILLIFMAFSSSCKFGHVLSTLELRTHLHIYFIIFRLCDARQPAHY